jgi:hypothetical protein
VAGIEEQKKGKFKVFFQSLAMQADHRSSRIEFEVGRLIDYSIVLKKTHEDQIRPPCRFLFVLSIALVLQVSKGKLKIESDLHVIHVFKSGNDYKKDKKIVEGINKLKLHFEEPDLDKPDKACFAVINYANGKDKITIDNLVADWRRLQVGFILTDEKAARKMSHNLVQNDKSAGYFSMRFGFDYTDTDSHYIVQMNEQDGACDLMLEPRTYTGPKQAKAKPVAEIKHPSRPAKKQPPEEEKSRSGSIRGRSQSEDEDIYKKQYKPRTRELKEDSGSDAKS